MNYDCQAKKNRTEKTQNKNDDISWANFLNIFFLPFVLKTTKKYIVVKLFILKLRTNGKNQNKMKKITNKKNEKEYCGCLQHKHEMLKCVQVNTK